MDSIFEELGIPRKFAKTTSHENRYIVLVHNNWLRSLVKDRQLPSEIPDVSRLEHWTFDTETPNSSWQKIYVTIYMKRDCMVIPLPRVKSSSTHHKSLMFSQVMEYVSSLNYRNLWKECYKNYGLKNASDQQRNESTVQLAKYDAVLREIINRTYCCSMINVCDSEISTTTAELFDPHPNIYPALCAVETLNAICVLHAPFNGHNLYDCVTFSPAILGASYSRPLFVIYQLLNVMKTMHDRSLTLGEIQLHDICVTKDMWLMVFPQLLSNIHVIELPENEADEDDLTRFRVDDKSFDAKKTQKQIHDTLEGLCDRWVNGVFSNFDYLMALNRHSYRKPGDPNRHPVFPWVTDFSSRCGKSWRDLRKSKFRLNKGDRQLDLTFSHRSSISLSSSAFISASSSAFNIPGTMSSTNTSSSIATGSSSHRATSSSSPSSSHRSHSHHNNPSNVPHHIPDVLSPITYYVYMARRTPRSVLQKHVRPVWVPAEYPASVQRLYAWSPDECIPEFYCDPTVFKSVHGDLDDLEVPVWCSSPEEFVQRHRAALESDRVSERLHHWIDLTFGFKLSGHAAVKSRNVCLNLVDGHTNLTRSGIVQLFTHPHPARRSVSPYFNKVPPKLICHTEPKSKKGDASTSTPSEMSRSEEEVDDDSGGSSQRSPLVLSRLLSRSRSSLNDTTSTDRDREHKLSRSPSGSGRSMSLGPKAATFTSHTKTATNGLIHLPSDYNPASALQKLEVEHNFNTNSFHAQCASRYTYVHTEVSAVDADYGGVQNAFTNQLFDSRFSTKSFTFPVDGNQYFVGRGGGRSRKASSVDATSVRKVSCNLSEIIATRSVKELQIFGCVIVEIFMAKQLRAVSRTSSRASSRLVPFNARLKSCLTILRNDHELPLCIQQIVRTLLQPDTISDLDSFQYPVVSNLGLPPLTAHLLLEPSLHTLIPFPKYYPQLYAMIKRSKDFQLASDENNIYNDRGDRTHQLLAHKIGECQVKRFVSDLDEMLLKADIVTSDLVEVGRLLTPYVQSMVLAPATSVLSIWYLFDPVARMLGPLETADSMLAPILRLYESNPSEHGPKIAKIYHHSFLLHIIVRLGLKCFLEHFITPLVEAVGGYRDLEPNSCQRKMSQLRISTSQNNLITDVTTSATATIGSNDLTRAELSPSDESSNNSTTAPPKKSADEKTTTVPEPEIFEFDNTFMDQLVDLRKNGVGTDSVVPRFHRQSAEEGQDAAAILDEFIDEDLPDVADPTAPSTMSPTIPIPTIANTKRSAGDFDTIQCEVGSRKSDSMEQIGSAMSGNGQEETMTTGTVLQDPMVTRSQRATHSKPQSITTCKISDMSADSVSWLAHRLGPVLTARHLSRNLLRMLTLCYVGNDNLQVVQKPMSDVECTTVDGGDRVVTRIRGDENAVKVFECLLSIAALYGEQIILLQYLPHMSELIALCKRKLTPNLEGGLISCLALLQQIIPYLSDSTLMDQLQDVILKNILHPCIRLLGSTKYTFPNGACARGALARKYISTLYHLAVRMGADNTRTHLAVPALQRFFLIFDKINSDSGYYGQTAEEKSDVADPSNIDQTLEESHFVELRRDGSTTEWAIGGRPVQISHVRLKDGDSADSLSPPIQNTGSSLEDSTFNQAIEEMQSVFTSALAYDAYVPFLRQIGQSSLEQALKNHGTVHNLCEDHLKESSVASPTASNNTPLCSSSGSSVTLVGNRIDIQRLPTTTLGPIGDQSHTAGGMSDAMENSGRHLRGNWLAYWEHEIGRAEKDTAFDFKQIKLQTFVGHTNAVRALHVLDNENSFLSGSRDKTVKLWSLRSAGDGGGSAVCQWTYTGHRKSVLSVTFVDSVRLVGSCDGLGAVHVWDPFLGGIVANLDGTLKQVNIVKAFPAPSTSLLAATTEGTLRVADVRIGDFIQDLKISVNPMGIIRAIAMSPMGYYLAAGQHSGQVTILDARTGSVMFSWRAHEGEVLQLAFIREELLISTSLDQSVAVWGVHDGKLKFYMKGSTEPVHCLNVYNGTSLITGTTVNKIGVHGAIAPDSPYTGVRLRPEVLRGLLTSTAVLPLNRLLLVGSEAGNISLLC